MKRAILVPLGALAASLALAACGGSGNASGTTAGVAGAHATITKHGASFSARTRTIETRLQAAMRKFERGDFAGAANVGGPLLTNCQGTVNGQLGARANTTQQQEAVSHLRTACQDIANASAAGKSGNLGTAKSLAEQALQEAQAAVAALR